jgi:hypothetical protein
MIIVFALVLAAGTSPARDLVERDTIRKTLKFTESGTKHHLIVDNINGSISVTGYGGNDVQLVAYKTITEVHLDIREDGDRIILYVESPGRRGEGMSHDRGWDHEGYDVEYRFELKVPSKTDINLKTVNGEEIAVREMEGDFEVRNVNGGVDMREIAGAGSVHTVNGNVRVAFSKNPGSESSFKTINGEVDVKFASTPSADFRFSTMNGDVYTDFDVKRIPVPTKVKETRRGKKVYSSGGSFMTRSGEGGPEITFSTLNGPIYLSLKGDSK